MIKGIYDRTKKKGESGRKPRNKRMNNDKIGSTALRICEIAIFVGAALTCISCLFGRDVFTIFNNLSSVTAVLLLVPLSVIFRKRLLKNRIEICVIFGFILLSVALSIFVSGLNLSHALTAGIGILTLYVMSFLPSKRDFQISMIFFLSIMSVCLFFLAIDYSQMTLVEKYNYTNSNVMGIVALLVNAYLMTMISMNGIKGKFIHLNVIVAVFAFTTITVFGCRSAQLAFFVFLIVAYVIPSRFWGRKRSRIAIIGAMVIGLVFPLVYLKMSEIGFDNIAFPLVNKPWFSGRDDLWSQGLNWLKETPSALLYGIGPKFSDITPDFNYHNSYVSILLNFGIPAFGAYYFSVERSAERAVLAGEDRKIRALQLALISMIMVVSLVETTIPATTFIWLYGICFIPLKKYSEN